MTTVQNLGTMVHAGFGQGAAIRFDGNRHRVCFVNNGYPAVVYEFDLVTGERLFQSPLPSADCVWGICSTESGDVYLSGTGDGVLYRLNSDGLFSLGTNPADPWVFQLYAEQDSIFGGTYPNSKLFEYDTLSQTFRDYGCVMPGEDYIRGLTADERWIYAGIGSTKHVIRIDRVTGKRTELQLDGISGSKGFVDRLWVKEDCLFVSCDFVNVHVFHLDSLERIGSFASDNMLTGPITHYPGLLFFKQGTKLCSWDMANARLCETGIDGLPPGRCKALEWLTPNQGSEKAPHLALVTVNAETAIIDLSNKQVTTQRLAVEPQPLQITCLETGPEGKLYLGGYQRGFSIYDPHTDKHELEIGLFPQIEGLTFLDGVAYFGTYTHANMFRYDPGQPLDFGWKPEHNPGCLGSLGHSQDRPFAMTTGGGLVFAGCIPDYGIRGGALGVHDPSTNEWKVYPDIVQEQSILGLAYQDGLLYGGTTVWGGLGTPPVEGPAKMFIWDVASARKVSEFIPEIPSLDRPPLMIGGLTVGPDGWIWGAIDGTIFAMEPETCRVVKSKLILPSEYKYSKCRPIYLKWGQDGLLYTTLGRRLTVIHPDTLEHVFLNDEIVGNMTLDQTGRVYYDAGKELYRLVPPSNLLK
ncbi:hypothetical protein [Paenibacillus dakarensis]|uniref:hypothetical protein n=1 Tax=Paenibacillus dakarensis TaxID=1527293 RepID=UPI0006D5A89F|nr:hypothetical protein [Paenibacillus dakarensis]